MTTTSPHEAAKIPAADPDHNTTLSALSDSGSEAGATDGVISDLKSKVGTLETEKGDLKKDNGNLKKDLDKATKENGDLKQDLDNGRVEITDLKQQVGTLENNNANLKKDLIQVTKERDDAIKDLDEATKERDDAIKGRDDAVKERDDAVKERDEAIQERDVALEDAARKKVHAQNANKRKREQENHLIKSPGGINALRNDRRKLEKVKDFQDIDLSWADSNVEDMKELATDKLGSPEKAMLWIYGNNRNKGALEDEHDPSKGFTDNVSHSLGAFIGIPGVAMDVRIQALEAQYNNLGFAPGVEVTPTMLWDVIKALPWAKETSRSFAESHYRFQPQRY